MNKIIHYCWFGEKKLPRSVQKCIKTWKKFLPDYEIKEWNESNFDINSCPFVKEAYENKKWAFVSDYARIYALYQEGGIYFDTDMKITKDISDIVDKNMFLGYEDSGYVGTAVIGVAETHNKYIKEILEFYNELEHFNIDVIYNYANPVIITKILKKYESSVDDDGITIFNDDVYIYPRDYFYPLSYNYAERVFTDNTCMIHLFNATWTNKQERRTINIYRKFGPRLGRYINTIIDGCKNCVHSLKELMLKFYKYVRLKVSIHINKNKRVNIIKNRLAEIEDKYIVISDPDKQIENDNIKKVFEDNVVEIRKQYTDKEARMIASNIIDSEKELVIFNSYTTGWDRIIKYLKLIKPKTIIKAIVYEKIEEFSENKLWEEFEKILNLYNNHEINEIGLFDANLYNLLKDKEYNVKLIKNKIESNLKIEKNKKKSEEIKVGLYRTIDNELNNIYTQLSAISKLENVKLDCEPINDKISNWTKIFNIEISGSATYVPNEELYKRMVNNDINLFVKLYDDNSILPAESLELGVVCLTGECEIFNGTELEEYIKVINPNNPQAIYDKINYAIENKEKILRIYKKWKEEYEVEYTKCIDNFLEGAK